MPCYRYQVNSSLDKKLGNDLYYVDGSFCDVACKVEQMSHQIGLTIIMPAFNEEMRLPSTMNVTLDHMQTYSEATGLTYEILVVDDYSTDKTSDLVLGYSRAEMMKRHNTLIANEEEMNDVSCSSSNDDSCDTTTAADTTKGGDVRLLQLRRNRGKGGAIRRGVLASRGQYILFADADGATDITYVDNLLSKLKSIEKHDMKLGGSVGMVVGSRAHLQNDSIAVRKWYRTVLMHGFHFLVKLLCTSNIKDTQCGFKLFTKQSAKILFTNLHLEGWVFDTEIIYLAEKMNMPLAEVAVAWTEVDGSKLIRNKLDVVINSVLMARDMLCMRIAYSINLWGLSSWA
jgi:dolichyl-phosphate beta-glucosyltransferase